MPRFLRYDELDSTNRLLKELARDGAENGTVVMADRQSAGRGRLGRSFFSPEGGLYMSMLLKGENVVSHLNLVTPMAAVAVRRAIRELTGYECSVKWVNDLYGGGKKFTGILAEAVNSAGRVDGVVIGIGVDLVESDFPPELRDIVTSLYALCGKRVSPEPLARLIAREMTSLASSLPDISFMDEYRSACFLTGLEVRVTRQGRELTGIVRGIADDASLLVESNGEFVHISTGEATVRTTR